MNEFIEIIGFAVLTYWFFVIIALLWLILKRKR